MLRRTGPRAAAGVALIATVQLLTAAPASAPHVAQLQVTPSSVAPGDQVTVFGPRGYGSANPVEVRFGSVTGPVLATFETTEENFAQFGPGPVTIPADTPPGSHRLVATQQLAADEQHIRGVPSAAIIEVTSQPAAAPSGTPGMSAELRPDTLATEPGTPLGLLFVIGAAVAGLAVAIGLAVAGSARKRSATEPTARVGG